MEWSVRNCSWKKVSSVIPKCWPQNFALLKPQAVESQGSQGMGLEVSGGSHWLCRFGHQGLLPAGWKPLSPGPLHLAPPGLVLGAWKHWAQTKSSLGLEAGCFRDFCQIAASCGEAQKIPVKQETFLRIPGLRPKWASTAVSETDIFLSFHSC